MCWLLPMLQALSRWPARRWLTAGAAAAAYALLIAIPTDLIDTPVFGRDIPPTAWAWPALLISAVLGGLLTATYVRQPVDRRLEQERAAARGGWAGGVLTFFAVGCPVCNKLVLLALGSAGAISWFQPVQPLLQLVAVAMLGWALHKRLTTENACLVPETSRSPLG